MRVVLGLAALAWSGVVFGADTDTQVVAINFTPTNNIIPPADDAITVQTYDYNSTPATLTDDFWKSNPVVEPLVAVGGEAASGKTLTVYSTYGGTPADGLPTWFQRFDLTCAGTVVGGTANTAQSLISSGASARRTLFTKDSLSGAFVCPSIDAQVELETNAPITTTNITFNWRIE